MPSREQVAEVVFGSIDWDFAAAIMAECRSCGGLTPDNDGCFAGEALSIVRSLKDGGA